MMSYISICCFICDFLRYSHSVDIECEPNTNPLRTCGRGFRVEPQQCANSSEKDTHIVV